MRSLLLVTLALALVSASTPAAGASRSFDDIDSDGRKNDSDNCPCAPNPDQNDADGDGIGDACDPAPSRSARPTPGVPASQDSDGDGVADSADNCPEKANPNQADADRDGVGDACDICLCVANPRSTAGPDTRQPDGDNDGVGDACDLCPDTPDPTQPTDQNGAGLQCPNSRAKVTSWEVFELKPRDRVVFFLRPLYAIWWGKNVPTRGASTAGVHLYASGSLDTWKYRPGAVPGAVAQPFHAEPPSWYWRAGLYSDLRFTDVLTAGPIVGVDFRPLNSPGYMNNTILSLLTLGLHAHFFYSHDFGDEGGNRADLGLGLKIGAFDALSVIPFAQLDLANGAAATGGVLVMFDLKVLDQLGVKDRVPLARRLLWSD